MTKLLKAAQAGTVESTDILVMLAPAEAGTGIKIDLTSPTMQQYGEHIKNLIAKTLKEYGIDDAIVHANEKGAMDCTIEARVTTAITRAIG
ncbi:MAG: citrate lyase acyl carrier protein [Negativicutes bacterium]|nr:citrate lyase acyl carrier protein [Negativicutes bacterium]